MGNDFITKIKKKAFEANLAIIQNKLVILTWGNASVIDRKNGIVAIKPSGVPYSDLKWQDIVIVNLNGEVVDSKLKPSSDTLTHLEIYKGFESVNGIVHTHSTWATIWSQSCKDIPVFGTTHADHFNGDIPCLPFLSKDKVMHDYVKQTGVQIVSYFKNKSIKPLETPGCLLSGHAPFTWGETVENAIENSIALESCAKMAYYTIQLNENSILPKYIQEKHFTRKHGSNSYYGQN